MDFLRFNSSKIRTFAIVIRMSHESLLLNYPAELRPRKGFKEQTNILLELRFTAQTSNP